MTTPIVRRALVAAVATGLAGTTAAIAAPAANGHGHGALKAALVPTTSQTLSQCAAASSGAAKGFAVLSAPGKPGGTPRRVVGTVALKKAAEKNATFEVDLAVGGTCQATGATLHTNGQGNGTAHFDVALPENNSATSYYVVLKAPSTLTLPLPLPLSAPIDAEAYATPAVSLS
jgi:hypothetical protein